MFRFMNVPSSNIRAIKGIFLDGGYRHEAVMQSLIVSMNFITTCSLKVHGHT